MGRLLIIDKCEDCKWYAGWFSFNDCNHPAFPEKALTRKTPYIGVHSDCPLDEGKEKIICYEKICNDPNHIRCESQEKKTLVVTYDMIECPKCESFHNEEVIEKFCNCGDPHCEHEGEEVIFHYTCCSCKHEWNQWTK